MYLAQIIGILLQNWTRKPTCHEHYRTFKETTSLLLITAKLHENQKR